MKHLLASVCLLFCCAPAFAVDKSPVVEQTNAIVEKINVKLRSGSRAAEDFKPEMAEFDALIAAHRSEKTDAVAAAILMKASFYMEVFQDPAEARKMLLLLKTDFSKSEVALHVDEMLALLKKQETARKIAASLTPGKPFPDFQEMDTRGKALSISALKGKVVLVDFWATWCPPCVQEMPNVVALYEKHHAAGFEIVGISLDQEMSKVSSFVAKAKMPWPQYFDGLGWDNKLAAKYGVLSIPKTFLLDRKGLIIDSGLTGDELASALEKALASQ